MPRSAFETGSRPVLLALVLTAAGLTLDATGVEAQRRDAGPSVTASVEIVFTDGDRSSIREYYSTHARPDAASLPHGIRKRLQRGKPLPPGIAKRFAPADLRSRVAVPDHYELVEVGLDVLLVEVATGVIHDVLMDVIR